jgi:hydroxyacylglutathione hydrolase
LENLHVHISTLRTPGLGDTTYLLSHAGVAVVVDPQRDVERFLEAAHEAGAEIRFVLETHVHNDYVSGGRILAGEAGARLLLPAGAGVAFEHVPAFHLEDVPADAGLVIRPIHTPGHTPEHVSYLVLLEGRPVAVFSGGSLLVGSAGRSDLLGEPRARQLARLQYGSVHRLAQLPDGVGLFPTHGEGSFCAATGAGRTSSTIGEEKRSNPVLAHGDADAFADAQLANLQAYPHYYAHMAPINVLGPRPLPKVEIPELSSIDAAARDAQTWLVDARPRAVFAAGHIPGALGIELADDFATWVGWLLPFDAPVMLVLEPDQSVAEVRTQLARIGFERVVGVVRGVGALRAEGRPLASFRTVDAAAFAKAVQHGQAAQVLDVRSPAEWQAGHLLGSVHHYLPDLTAAKPEGITADRDVWVACASGYRASIAAGLLERAGYRPVVLLGGGIGDVLAALSASHTERAAA